MNFRLGDTVWIAKGNHETNYEGPARFVQKDHYGWSIVEPLAEWLVNGKPNVVKDLQIDKSRIFAWKHLVPPPAREETATPEEHYTEACKACEYYGKAPGPSEQPDRHPNSARFHALLEEAGALHDQKQADYGKDDDPFANVRSTAEWGIPAWQGAMIRLNDKVKRLQSLGRKGSLANEAAVDSFMDIAVYALIARVLYEEELAAID